ncbi:MAG: DUF4382 domain-containing protein [Dehalococcoidales bacterium]|nr:DUF4382 domain-containing protein [Dehalococcoidales bacterium]
MKSKALLLVTVFAVLSLMMIGCSAPYSLSDGGASTGSIQVKITDAPADVEEVNVTLTGVKIHPAGGPDEDIELEAELEDEQELDEEQNDEDGDSDGETSGTQAANTGKGQDKGQKGNKDQKQILTQAEENKQTQDKPGKNSSWITLDLSEELQGNDNGDIIFNLLDFQNELEALLASGDAIPAGKYTQLRLEVSEVWVKESGKDPVQAKLPSNTLKLVHPFEIVDGMTTEIVVDWDAEKSLNFTGNGQIICKPVIKVKSAKAVDDEDKEEDTLKITPQLPVGVAGEDYEGKLTAEGGEKPYTWTIIDNDEVEWLTLDDVVDDEDDFVGVSGQPDEAGEFTFTVRVEDSSDPGQGFDKTFTINVLDIALEPIEDTEEGEYQGQLNAEGGEGNYKWSIVEDEDNDPDGLSVGENDGIVSFTFNEPGVYTFTIEVEDESDPPLVAARTFAVNIE